MEGSCRRQVPRVLGGAALSGGVLYTSATTPALARPSRQSPDRLSADPLGRVA